MEADLPAWLEVRRDNGAILLVAPHGGRRPPLNLQTLPPNLRVNDLFTADLTRELSLRLGATAIINHGLDRNQLDLNRLTQVRRRAPWFVELLSAEIDRLCLRHSSVTVLFIHGWNTGQAKCDVGVGARGQGDDPIVDAGAQLTVDGNWLRRFLRALSDQQRFTVALGERYPASHPNNLVQLFRHRVDAVGGSETSVMAHAVAGRARALQLELGVPLRWPGPLRGEFVEVLARAVAAAESEPTARPLRPPLANTPIDGPLSLQSYDAGRGLGLSVAIGPLREGTIGRALLFLGGQRIALFTGEEPAHRAVHPLRLEHHGESIRVAFDGAMLMLDDASLYLDLENAMACSRLIEVSIDATFEVRQRSTRWPGLVYGAVDSRIEVDGKKLVVAAPAVGGRLSLRSGGELIRSSLIATVENELIVARALVSGEVHAERVLGAGVATLTDSRMEVDEDEELAPRELRWQSAAGEVLYARPISRMPIVRGLGSSGYLRVTFGIAEVEIAGRRGHALYEHSVMVPRST